MKTQEKRLTITRKKMILIGVGSFIAGWFSYFGIKFILDTTQIIIVSAIAILTLIALLYKFVNFKMKEEIK